MIPWTVTLGAIIGAFLTGCAMGVWLARPAPVPGEDLVFCEWCDGYPDSLPSDCECLGDCGRRQCMRGTRITDMPYTLRGGDGDREG